MRIKALNKDFYKRFRLFLIDNRASACACVRNVCVCVRVRMRTSVCVCVTCAYVRTCEGVPYQKAKKSGRLF